MVSDANPAAGHWFLRDLHLRPYEPLTDGTAPRLTLACLFCLPFTKTNISGAARARHIPGIFDFAAKPKTDVVARKPAKVKLGGNAIFKEVAMSAPAHKTDVQSTDPVEAVIPLIPIVLPIVGGVLMFLLAFIAVSMA